MFYDLPEDIQNYIDTYNPDFTLFKIIILRNKVEYQENAYKKIKLSLSNQIQKKCTHQIIIAESDHDYHKPRYEYWCRNCNKLFYGYNDVQKLKNSKTIFI